jgi:hypothetical protein
MIAKLNTITSLINDLSISLHSLVSKNEAGAALGPTPLNIYRAASLIYQLRQQHNEPQQHVVTSITKASSSSSGDGTYSAQVPSSNISDQLEKAFDTIQSSLGDSYLANVILKDMNAAFRDLAEQAMTSLHELTLHPNVRQNKERVEKDLSNCLNAMKALNIVYCGRDTIAEESKVSHMQKGEETNAMRCCRLGFSPNLCSDISFLYDAVCQANSSVSPELQDCLLGTLSCLLCHGLIIPSVSNHDFDLDEDDAIQSVMATIQSVSIEQGQDSTCLGDLIQWQEESKRVKKISYTLKDLIESTFSNQVLAQKEYLFQMLDSSPRTTTSQENNQTHTVTSKSKSDWHSKKKSSTASAPSKVSQSGSYQHRLVSKLRELFPSYGEGYLEAALVCYDHDVERTTLALLELQSNPNSPSIHPRLKVLDPTLPSRRKGGKERYDDKDTEEDLEAREIQRAHMKEMQIQQENEAFLLSAAMGGEYNDEYDDQYDGIGEGEDGVGGMDSGLYDADYEAIKAYNKVARELEADRIFWDEARNTNQRKKTSRDAKNGSEDNKDDDDDDDDEGSDGGSGGEKKYRGPDKGKGGRVIGPDGKYLPVPKSRKKVGGNKSSANKTVTKTSGKDENSQQQVKKGSSHAGKESKTSEEMTKLQKRRKNDNKAKIANHHRKERSLKKSAGM